MQGRESLASLNSFFEHYDYAITGTIGTITTNEDGESNDYGFTRIEVAVIAGYGIEAVPAFVTISQPDPGWLLGYPFESGGTYFIPITVTRGADGNQNSSNLCDPITQLSIADAEALESLAIETIVVVAPPSEASSDRSNRSDDQTSRVDEVATAPPAEGSTLSVAESPLTTDDVEPVLVLTEPALDSTAKTVVFIVAGLAAAGGAVLIGRRRLGA